MATGVTAVCPPPDDSDDWLLRLSLEPQTTQICSGKVKYVQPLGVYALCYGESVGVGRLIFNSKPPLVMRLSCLEPKVGVSVGREK